MTTNPTTINDFQLSMKKEKLSQLNVGSYFVPCNEGKTYFKPYLLESVEVVGPVGYIVKKYHCKCVETGFFCFVFNNQTTVVRCVPHGTKPQVRVIDVIVDAFAEKWDGCKNEYKSPAHIIFDRSTVFGVFDEIPSTKGLALNSPEHEKASEEFDSFYTKCERFDFDLADFFAWAMMANKLDDYNTKQRGGMVAIDSADYPDEASAKGRKYGDFEWAFNVYFNDCDFQSFLTAQLNK